MPWWAKIRIKMLLSRVPVSYRSWQKLALFQHGYMEEPEYAFKVFQTHFESASVRFGPSGFTALELGPGDSLFSALIANAYGASKIYLVDVDKFAREDLPPYREMLYYIANKGMQAPDIRQVKSLNTMLSLCRASYLTEGLESLKSIPDASIDFLWSNAVLEHVRLDQFEETIRETRRILKPTGVASHQVDLRDHLGGALNNLRYTREKWESPRMSQSGFYTNRIRFAEMLRIFKSAGFHIDAVHAAHWEKIPTSRRAMQPEFSSLKDADLLVKGFSVVLTPTEPKLDGLS